MRTRSLGSNLARLALAFALAWAVAACGGDDGGDDGGGGADTITGDDVAATDAGGGGADGAASDDTGGEPGGDLVIELFGLEPETTVTTESNLAVQTRVYDPEALEPVPGVPVTYALEVVTPPDAGQATGALTETIALTGDNGVAEVRFSAGSAAGAVYRITASAEGAADPVTLTVTVAALATGAIEVTFDYEGDEPPVDVRVLLLMDVFPCGGFNPGDPPETPLAAEVPFADGAFTSGPLQQSPNWNVLLIGLDGAGSVVAGGCAAEIRVVADVTTDVAVTMTPVGLHLPGIYDWTETLDLSAARPATADELATTLTTLLADPRATVTAALGDAITAQLEAADPEGECAGLWQGALPAAVEAAVPATADWVTPFADLGTRLDAALAAVTLEADLTVTGLPPGPYTGDIDWRAVTTTFDGQAVRWEPVDFDAVVYPIRLGEETTTWGARVDGYDDLVIDDHELVLEPGRIAAALVTDLVLAGAPAAPAPLEDVAVAFFECPAVAAALPGEVTACLAAEQIAVEDVADACEALVREHVGPANDLLESWVTPTVLLDLAGAGTVVDENQDLGVDRVEGGTLQGTLTVDDAAGGDVSGDFRMTAAP